MRIKGQATSSLTKEYSLRYQGNCAEGHFRQADGLFFSSFGIGTYLGKPNQETDTLVTNAILESVKRGINLIDTAINYRYMHAEKSIKQALLKLLEANLVSREELIICTKGGFIPHPDRVTWFTKEYVKNSNFNISERDCVAKCHCMHPEYLRHQLNLSLNNLGIETLDIYYIHNPETQLGEVSQEVFSERLYYAFEVMESAIQEGKIKAYGLATWNGFRVPQTDKKHLNLSQIKALASKAAGNTSDSFKFIQLPVNTAMTEALVKPTQQIGETVMTTLEAAKHLGINVIASASLAQTKALGKIPKFLTSSRNLNIN